MDRRRFLRQAGAAGTFAAAAFTSNGLARVLAAGRDAAGVPPDALAEDEVFWREIQSAFTLDRTLINLNNGGCCPSPRVVHEALKRYLDLSNEAPVYHMWQILEPNIETVRRNLAAEAGCDPATLAITRNASEALQISQLGIDLEPGDEVLTTNQDYGRMIDTWQQRVRRDGIVLTQISFPVPPPSQQDLVDRFAAAITPRTKVLHFCHITNLTGHIFPVRQICDLARARGITTVVDGAHAFGHFPFAIRDLNCDYYGTSLHKWLLAPIGTGFLHVRADRIAKTWAMQPTAASRDGDIRKFEEIGTHPAANHNAIAEALVFHQGIGIERRIARMVYLRNRWIDQIKSEPRVRMLTSLREGESGAIGTVHIDGMKPGDITAKLWEKWRIIATPIGHAEYDGVRVTPNVYTTLDEVDTFARAMTQLARS
jgi:selenocysteine lyase/cysteine desulfurase